MTRSKIAYASIVTATLGTLLMAGAVQASSDAQLENLLTHGASTAAELQASDGNPISVQRSAEHLLIHTGDTFPADLAAKLQASDGSSQAFSYAQRLLTHDVTGARTVMADGDKARNKMATSTALGTTLGSPWSDGGH